MEYEGVDEEEVSVGSVGIFGRKERSLRCKMIRVIGMFSRDSRNRS